ncbi:MAG: sulfatase [Planctomycetota bacterium]
MSDRPNVIFITSHDVGRHLGCYGARVNTPRLDAFASAGVRCDTAWCAAPICSPARAAFATGRFPHANGVRGLTHFGWDLHEGETHLAERFAGAGYTTALAGLQHETRHPDRRGLGNHLTGGSRSAKVVGETAAAFFGEVDGPFYLQVGFFEPHRDRNGGFGPYPPARADEADVFPWLAPTPEAVAEVAKFNGAIEGLDEGVGLLLDGLDASGHAENTLVVFVSDHGVPFPLAKASCYEAGLGVVLLARWPGGGIDGGRVVDLPIAGVDVTPTILDAVGLRVDGAMHGRSVLSAWRGGPMDARPIFGEIDFHGYHDPIRAVRFGGRKLIVNFAAAPRFYDTSQQWHAPTRPRHIDDPRNEKHPRLELFNLDTDPHELTNVADDPAFAADRRTGLQLLADHMRATDDPLLTQPPHEPAAAEALALLREGV